MSREIKPGQFYRHFKNKLYQIVAIAIHSETGEAMVVYQALYGDYKIYVRPYDMFVSEVDHVKYPEVKQKYRFQQIEFISEKKEVSVYDELPMREQVPVVEQTSTYEESPERDMVNPDLMHFLETDSYEDKILVLQSMKKRLTPQILQTIAVSLDYTLEDGDLTDQYESVMYYLETRVRYEGRRLR